MSSDSASPSGLIIEEWTQCPDCAQPVGSRHETGCMIARCSTCGEQLFTCSLTADHDGPTTVDSMFPGMREAMERGWVTEQRDGTTAWNLNRVYVELVWNADSQTRVEPTGNEEP